MSRRTNKDNHPDDVALSPIEFYPGSNGEAPPAPPSKAQLRAYETWQRLVDDKHKRLGLSRRAFANSACGMATALLVLEQAGCGHSNGAAPTPSLEPSGANEPASGVGGKDDPTLDMAAAREKLSGDEFIVDVHTHPPNGRLLAPWQPQTPQQEALDYIKKMFVQSDVAISIITGWPNARKPGEPSALDKNESNVKANAILNELVDRMGGERFLFHANANPDLDGEPEYIEKLAASHKNICAWKVYPAPNDATRLHRRTAFLERVRKTGIKIIAAHRGIHNDDAYGDPGSPEDVVQAALLFPDIKFLVYHSGFDNSRARPTAGQTQGYVDSGAQTRSVDRFVKAMRAAKAQNGGKPLTNVYADLGTTWATVMADDTVAGHLLGKLLLEVGVDQVLFGTDSFNGNLTPQAQIARFRTFDIPAALKEKHGYPALTPEIRRKVLGLNAAAVYGLDPQKVRYRIKDDDVAKLKTAYQHDPRAVPMPHPHRHRGPRSRREFLAFQAWERKTWG